MSQAHNRITAYPWYLGSMGMVEVASLAAFAPGVLWVTMILTFILTSSVASSGKAVVSSLGPSILDCSIPALLIAKLAQARAQGVNLVPVLRVRRHAKKADAVVASSLLRARRQRPCSRRSAEQRDELAPPHVGHGLPPAGHCALQNSRPKRIPRRV